MRDYLKKVAHDGYWVYGITEEDFSYTVDLIQQVVSLRTEQHQAYAEKVRQSDPESADDILDDIAYYKHVDEQHLWQYAFVRLQGLIEEVMTYELANLGEGYKLFGLASKIQAVIAQGYSVTEDEESELLSWGRLRNAFAHAPPEKYRPILRKEDVIEYQKFVLALYSRWKEEKEAKVTHRPE